MFNGVTMLNQQPTRPRGCVVDIVVIVGVGVDAIVSGDDGFGGYGGWR